MATLKFVHSSIGLLFENLSNVLAEDEAWQSMDSIEDSDLVQRLISHLFIKYVLITNSFTRLLNMSVMYHKRERLKQLVSNLLCRVIELKAEMAKIMKTEYPYLDDAFIDLEISRRDVEIIIPDYYSMERLFVVREFVKYAQKIKEGLVLRPIPSKPVPELTLDLRKFYLADAKLKEILESEKEGKRIERLLDESGQKVKVYSSTAIKRPPKFLHEPGNDEMRKVILLMGSKRENVFRAMRAVAMQPLNEPYESYKFPFARDLVRTPYFLGKNYFSGYEKLTNPFEFGKFIKAIALFQKHERARIGGVYYLIKKERFEKMFVIIMNRRKGIQTELRGKDDFRYPILYRDHSAAHRKRKLGLSMFARQANSAIAALGLLPHSDDNSNVCNGYHQYKSQLRILIELNMITAIEVEAQKMIEWAKNANLRELDIIDEILEYFKTWHQASKPTASKLGWDLLDLPNPDKKILPPPAIVAGIPKSLTDNYVEKNFDRLSPAVLNRPAFAGSALIVSGNHITKEKYLSVKPLALARQAMPKEAREAEALKSKEQREKDGKNKKKAEQKGYKPQKSQIPALVLHRSKEILIAQQYEQDEIHPLIISKDTDEQELDCQVVTDVCFRTREVVDKNMIAFQKHVRSLMTKKHRKAENLKKRNIPAMKKPKKEWALKEQEKWETVYALAKDGYFQNYRKYTVENMPGSNIFSFSNYEWIREYLSEPEPFWGDLYQLVKILCVFPLADSNVRQYGPVVSAVGFVGPQEVINRLLCSVSHDSGALLIRVDPSRAEGEIPFGKLATTILKMAKTAQPTIIVVDDCHLIYPKRMKGMPAPEKSPYVKTIQKIKKGINRKFKILMVGLNDKPELTNGKRFSKVFDKVIAFPHKDYHASADYWGKYLFKNESLAQNFPYPALVEPTKTYKTPEMTMMFKEDVLTPNRKKELVENELNMSEFIHPLRIAAALSKTAESFKMSSSGYAWASGQYKSFKSRKKILKELLDEKLGSNNKKDKRNKK